MAWFCLLQVRSATLDTWTPELVEAMERAGNNDVANAYYEHLLPRDHRPHR